MLFHRPKGNKSKAQTLVEFALALPILMAIVLGLIEVGRILFIKSSVSNAAREAVRYGSATGGTDANPALPRYRDCNGIIAAAQDSSFINNITIRMWMDKGPSTARSAICPPAPTATSPFNQDELADPYKPRWRIVVEVSSDFVPIVPIPGFSNFTITSESARTIVGTVYLNQK